MISYSVFRTNTKGKFHCQPLEAKLRSMRLNNLAKILQLVCTNPGIKLIFFQNVLDLRNISFCTSLK